MKTRTALILSLAASLALPAFVSAQNASAEEQAALDAMIRARGGTPATPAPGAARGTGPAPTSPRPPAGVVMRGGPMAPNMAPVEGPFTATLQSISESRNMNANAPMSIAQNNQALRLSILLTGDDVNKAMNARKVTVTKAVSDLDEDLVPTLMPGQTALGMSPISNMMNSNVNIANRRGINATATLRSASRAAKSIKLLEGQVELFTPAEDNGSKLVIPNIASMAGKLIEDPVLTKNGVQFYFINAQSQMAVTQQMGARAASPLGLQQIDFSQTVVLYFMDPNSMLGGYEFDDANGNRIQTGGGGGSSSQTSATMQVRLQAPLPADAQLVIYVAVPEAVKTFPLKMENVNLP